MGEGAIEEGGGGWSGGLQMGSKGPETGPASMNLNPVP